MNNSYVIQWKSKVNGRAGRGTKHFEKDEVDRLVEELNREYPQIEHQAIAVSDETSTAPATGTAEEAITEPAAELSVA